MLDEEGSNTGLVGSGEASSASESAEMFNIFLLSLVECEGIGVFDLCAAFLDFMFRFHDILVLP